jgi:hypothetical protein
MRNAIRHAWFHGACRTGSCRALRGSRLVDVDAQWSGQRLQINVFGGVCPTVIEGQHGFGTPHSNVALQRAQLAAGELAWVALLQFIEDRTPDAFGLGG